MCKTIEDEVMKVLSNSNVELRRVLASLDKLAPGAFQYTWERDLSTRTHTFKATVHFTVTDQLLRNLA